jgi:exocyst complex component 5
MLETIENKLDVGLDRSLSAVFGWVKLYLQNEQKKSDFKPETDVDTMASMVGSSAQQLKVDEVLKLF